jgi:hypothetical protein
LPAWLRAPSPTYDRAEEMTSSVILMNRVSA